MWNRVNSYLEGSNCNSPKIGCHQNACFYTYCANNGNDCKPCVVLICDCTVDYTQVRWSNRHWSGLWSELVIEQTLLKSIKSQGWPKNVVWHLLVLILSCLNSSNVHELMLTLSGLESKSSKQHMDIWTNPDASVTMRIMNTYTSFEFGLSI